MRKPKVIPKVPVVGIPKKRGAIKRVNPRAIAIAARRFKVIDMRASGASYEEIAEALHISIQLVASDVQTLMADTAKVTEETTEVARHVADRRLDKIIAAHMPHATTEREVPVRDPITGAVRVVKAAPSTAHAQIVLQVDQRKAKLLGLDKPEEKHLKVSGIREYIGVDWEEV